jgi:putative transcriptional regulator
MRVAGGETKMNKFSRDLIQAMSEAVAFAEGKKSGARVTVVEAPDVRAIRRGLHMSQQRFAETYRIPLPTLKTGNRAAGRPTPLPRLISWRLRGSRK